MCRAASRTAFNVSWTTASCFTRCRNFIFAELARGIRWNDPAVGIHWPLADAKLSERDQNLPLLASIT